MPFEPQQGEDTSIRDSLAMRQLGTTISPKDIDTALKPYQLQDTKVKGMTDKQLYSMAQQGVVKWWQRQQKAKITGADGKANTRKEIDDLAKMNKNVQTALGKIPAIHESAGTLRNREAKRLEAIKNKPNILIEFGLTGVDPPDYAMVSNTTLRAWAGRQRHRRNVFAGNRRKYL